MKKKKLRKVYLKKQQSLTKTERQEKSLQIKEHFFAKFDLKEINVLHLFLSMKANGEVETSFILNRLEKDFSKIKTIVPRVNFEKDILEHLELNSETEIIESEWGIKEPVGNNFIDEREIDLVLVPLLCFDERGYRVGYGKGFYDKFLSQCRKDCLKIGVSFFKPIREIEDIHKFDVGLDFCITPEKVYEY